MSFDFSDYVDVQERLRIGREMWPEMTLQPLNPLKPFEMITVDGETFAVYVAALYKRPDDLLPSVGLAWEQVPGKTPYTRGSELMNAETSAWGRALIAAGVPSKRIASKNEVMARMGQVADIAESVVQTIAPDLWKSKVEGEYLPHECRHGNRSLITNENKEDGKRKYYGYKCASGIVSHQCDMNWYTLDADGKWIWKPKNG